jgi:hypothetical protein
VLLGLIQTRNFDVFVVYRMILGAGVLVAAIAGA